MSGELMETYNEYGHIILPARNKNAINKINALINAEEELTAESFISPRNLPPPSVITAPLPIPSSANNSRMKYYRSLQKLSEKKHQTQPQPQRSNLSPKSESRQGRAGAVQSNNDSDHQNDADRDTRRFSDPQYYRSEPIAIPPQSSGFSSSHRFRSALHPRLVVDSSASFVLPAPSYLPTPQRKSYMPFNHQAEDDDNREGTRKKLSKKYQLEDKQFKINRNSRHDDHHDNLSQEEDDDGGFAFEMEL